MKDSTLTRFIEKTLVEKIKNDSKKFKILNERDLESSMYYHLRKFLKNEKYKISTNFTVSGASPKRKRKGERKFFQPDLVILEWKSDFEKPKMRVAIELKARSPYVPIDPDIEYYDRRFDDRDMLKDFTKLNLMIKEGITDYCYFFYLYFDMHHKETKIKRRITNHPKLREILFKPIVINKFENTKTHRLFNSSKARKFTHRSRQLYQYYTPEEHDPKDLWGRCEVCKKLYGFHSERQHLICENKIWKSIATGKA